MSNCHEGMPLGGSWAPGRQSLDQGRQVRVIDQATFGSASGTGIAVLMIGNPHPTDTCMQICACAQFEQNVLL